MSYGALIDDSGHMVLMLALYGLSLPQSKGKTLAQVKELGPILCNDSFPG